MIHIWWIKRSSQAITEIPLCQEGASRCKTFNLTDAGRGIIITLKLVHKHTNLGGLMPIPRRTRIINSSRVIRELWINGTMSRAALAKSLDMNKSSMTAIVDELIRFKVIFEGSIIEPGPKGGRKATGLQLNKDWFYVLGLELRSDSYSAVAVDIQGNVLFSKTEKRGFSSTGFTEAFLALMSDMQSELEYLNRPLLGVGVGFSGIVDSERQIIHRSVSLEFSAPFDFGEVIAAHYDFPVILENDANCGAWGEVVFHRKRQLKNYLFLLLEFWKHYSDEEGRPRPTIGIGFGFGGKIYHGSNWSSGEFKSMCNSDSSNDEQIRLPSPSSARDITEDQDALFAYIRELCRNIAFLVNTLDIGNVFIGGDVDTFRSFIVEMLYEELRGNSLNHGDPKCTIQFSSLGYQAVAFGAAALVLDKLFMDLEPLDHFEKHRLRPLYFMEE